MLISESGAFDYCFKRIRIKSFMGWNSYAMSAVGHAYVLTLSNDFKSRLAKCPDSAIRRDISKELAMRKPLLRRPFRPLSPPLSFGGMS